MRVLGATRLQDTSALPVRKGVTRMDNRSQSDSKRDLGTGRDSGHHRRVRHRAMCRLAAERNTANCFAAASSMRQAIADTARCAARYYRAAVLDGDAVRVAAGRHRRAAAHSRHVALVGIEPESIQSRRRTRARHAGLLRLPAQRSDRRPLARPSCRRARRRAACRPSFVNTILANAMLQEFVPFIVLLFSLYTISGGIRIAGDLRGATR